MGWRKKKSGFSRALTSKAVKRYIKTASELKAKKKNSFTNEVKPNEVLLLNCNLSACSVLLSHLYFLFLDLTRTSATRAYDNPPPNSRSRVSPAPVTERSRSWRLISTRYGESFVTPARFPQSLNKDHIETQPVFSC